MELLALIISIIALIGSLAGAYNAWRAGRAWKAAARLREMEARLQEQRHAAELARALSPRRLPD